MSDGTRVRISLPLPLDVAATITKLIGVAYPTSTMATDRYGTDLVYVIPDGARAKAVSKRAGKPITHEEGAEATLLALGPDGIKMSAEILANICRQVMEEGFANNPEAINYLEQVCHVPATGKQYIMTFQRGEGSTPHQKREEAEAKLRAVRHLHSPDSMERDDSYEAAPYGQCNGCLQVDPGGWAPWPCLTAQAAGATEQGPTQ